jgi:hypothetical protein
MTIEDVSEEDLFNGTVSDEATDSPVVAEQAEQPEQARDEGGRFAKEEPEAEVVAEQVEKPAVDDNAPLVPSWRLREINEEKRLLAADNERMRAELAQSRQQQPRQEQSNPAQKAEEEPDPLLNPKEYREFIERRIEQRILNDRREESLLRARDANQQEFDEAYAAAQKAVDPALKARMQSSRDPGKTLLEWHRDNKTKAEIGSDLAAYKQRLREEALKDPEFRKAAMEAWRSDAQPQSKGGRPLIELPPSTNSVSRSNALLRSTANDDVSDEQLFQQLTG